MQLAELGQRTYGSLPISELAAMAVEPAPACLVEVVAERGTVASDALLLGWAVSTVTVTVSLALPPTV